jgi:hypothetical protein
MRVDLTLALRYNRKLRNPIESVNDIYTKNRERERICNKCTPRERVNGETDWVFDLGE